MIEMRMRGMSINEIAKELNMAPSTVHYHLKKHR